MTRTLIMMLAGVLAAGLPVDLPADPVKNFLARCGEKAKAADEEQRMAVKGQNGWLFLAAELRHLSVGKFWGPGAARVSQARRPEHADPLPAILDFKSQLDRAGIELWLVPVPPKAAVYPEMLTDSSPFGEGEPPPRVDFYDREFYNVLAEKGVKVRDLWPELVRHRHDKKGAMYCLQDSHWSGLACRHAARLLASDISRRRWAKAVPKSRYALVEESVEITGDLTRGFPELAAETLTLGFVKTGPGPDAELVEPDRESPIVLLGDSHCLVFHAGGDLHASGAGLADHLALALRFPLDVVAVRGSGATPARINLMRRVRSDPEYLQRKKLVIWCFGAREFTESSGWRKIPLLDK